MRKTERVEIRVTLKELARIRGAAKDVGVSVSDYVRGAVMYRMYRSAVPPLTPEEEKRQQETTRAALGE